MFILWLKISNINLVYTVYQTRPYFHFEDPLWRKGRDDEYDDDDDDNDDDDDDDDDDDIY